MKKILMVDDDESQLFSMKILLETVPNEYEFIGAKNGKEGLALLKAGQLPDLILLDIMMPGISGWELYDVIKKNPVWEKIPIIFVTARTDDTAQDAGKFLGDGYITKPYDSDGVLKIIKEKTEIKHI